MHVLCAHTCLCMYCVLTRAYACVVLYAAFVGCWQPWAFDGMRSPAHEIAYPAKAHTAHIHKQVGKQASVQTRFKHAHITHTSVHAQKNEHNVLSHRSKNR